MGTALLGAAFISMWSHRIRMPAGDTGPEEEGMHTAWEMPGHSFLVSRVTRVVLFHQPELGFHVPLLCSTTGLLSTGQDMGQGQEWLGGTGSVLPPCGSALDLSPDI